jgi:RNA polymerase sigma-70 factor (ECF subfamily)
MSTETKDQELVQKYLAQRDEESFRQLYRRHTPALYGLALRLCRVESDAQDAIQESWIRACTALSSFQWRSTLRTWLTGILINCIREQSRKRSDKNETDCLIDEGTLVVDTMRSELNVEQAIARLPDGYRHVLTLHDIAGYTHEEISTLLDISIGSSKSQLHHARRAFRKLFVEGHRNGRIRRGT